MVPSYLAETPAVTSDAAPRAIVLNPVLKPQFSPSPIHFSRPMAMSMSVSPFSSSRDQSAWITGVMNLG